jgi:hypothetical protein
LILKKVGYAVIHESVSCPEKPSGDGFPKQMGMTDAPKELAMAFWN